MKGDTVNGTWASNGCDPGHGQTMLGNGNDDLLCVPYILISDVPQHWRLSDTDNTG